MGDFAADTAVEGGDGRYRARLVRDWEVWGPNGGYLAVIALRAAGAAAPFRRPASFTCHFLRVARFDEVTLAVETLHAGRRAASLRVVMTQDGRPVLEALAWMVADADGLEHEAAPLPAVPPPEALADTGETAWQREHGRFPFWQNVERRTLGWAPPERWRPRPPEYGAWFRFQPEPVFTDPLLEAGRTLVLLDTTLWAAAWRLHGDGAGYRAPSLDLAARFHRAGSPCEWLFCESTSPIATEGLVGAQARVWSRDGKLLASGGGQLLCVPEAGLSQPSDRAS